MKQKNLCELRYDPVNRDWVVVASHRAKRPRLKTANKALGAGCPFCDYFKNPKFKNKNIISVPNKFPAFSPVGRGLTAAKLVSSGLFEKMPAVGFHEVVILKDHSQVLADLPKQKIKELLDVYQGRYLALAKEKFANYIFIFHNQGKTAGASIGHPHSQIIAVPLTDFDFQKPLKTSAQYFKEKNRCLFCDIIGQETKAKQRIVFENSGFAAFCPFAGKFNYEVIIAPKTHQSRFEAISDDQKDALAEILKAVLSKIKKGLKNPDYNFYLQTAGCDSKNYSFFHWHLTICPRLNIQAGFELGAGMEITTVAPEAAAEHLRKVKL
ncbi:MAG: galactose-1-phosphate uridylyltransferase [Patescibacteria group bacterium]|nr:galactose-1-phosphate uridylyltransferase [Patescibacteria group bacterium]